MTFEFGPAPARLSGLFRLRIKPRDNDSMFTVDFQNLPWYAMECWEPRNNFYIFGVASLAPVKQYFFIPRLTEDDDYVRVRLQTGNNIEKAQIDIYTETGTDPIATAKCKGKDASGGDHPWFDTARIEGDDLPSGYPGAIYRFKLTNPVSTGRQPSGNTWVRFSKNVVPYFSGRAERLIYPILHQRIDPVSYVDESRSHRLYLTVPRTVPSGETAIIPEASELKLKTGTSPESDTTTGFSVTTTLTLDTPQKIERGDNLIAQLLDGDTVVADSTDKVDALYGIREPVYDSDFPAKMTAVWDNGNGRTTSGVLKGGHVNTVQTSNETSIPQIIAQEGLKAWGALYTPPEQNNPPIKAWFKTEVGGEYPNANSENVRFWGYKDEPDSGPGYYRASGNVYPVTALKDLYDAFLCYTGYTSKPFQITIQHTIFIEEYSRACDIIGSDPYVCEIKNWPNANRARDCAAELTYNKTPQQKRMLIMWWWDPKLGVGTAVGVSLFGDAFAESTGMESIGSWNFSSAGEQLNSVDPALWTEITNRNNGWINS